MSKNIVTSTSSDPILVPSLLDSFKAARGSTTIQKGDAMYFFLYFRRERIKEATSDRRIAGSDKED